MIKDSKINPVYIMTNHTQANSNSGRSTISTNRNPHPLRTALRRFAATAALLLGIALPTSAADYVIAYTSGNQTYYVGMNSSNQLIATTNFDMSCIWTCINRNNNTGNTLSTTDRRRLKNKKNTNYYLNASVSRAYNYNTYSYTYTWNISASTTASQYWYGTNGSSLYHTDNSYSQGNGYLHPSGSSVTISTSNSNAFIPYQVSTASASATTQRAITNLTITPSASTINYNSSQEFNASATSSTRSIPAHTTYTFNGITYYYYNNTFYPSTEDFCSYSSASFTIDYTWSKSGDGSSNLTLSTTSGNRTTATNSNSGSQDQTVTLTVTASATNATSSTFTTSLTIWSATQTPTITRLGNDIYLSSTSSGATIYYTTNGDTPTSSSNVYSGPFSIEQLNHPVTIKAIAIRGGSSSGIASQRYDKPKCATPVITISSSGNVDITCSTTDAQIRYTTDGTNPDGSSSLYNGSLVVSNLQTVKAIAIKTNYDNSELASEQYVTTGTTTSGEIVLDDREDHTWAYYSDENSPIHCLKPADIKITYKGYGDKTMTSSNTDRQPANSAFDQDVANTAVQVNKNEAGHTFIYYKTLENANEDGTGNYPYTMIPNPFQVRPTYGTGNGRWRGFYAWRVNSMSSGLSIKVGNTTYNKTQAEGSLIIYAEQEVEFITANAKGNEVTFEALWAKAYLDDGNNYYTNNGDYRNAYERNFKKVTSLSTYSYPVTISSISPDGSGSVASVSGPNRSNYTCNNDVKLENMNLNMSNYYIDGNSYNLTIGRGVKNGNNNVASSVYGDYSGSSVRSKFTLRIESGRYGDARVFYNSSRANCSDSFTSYAYIGSDYDRANNENNDNLVISSRVGLSSEMAFTNTASSIDVTVLSGTFGSNTADVEFYMGYQNATSGTSQAKRSIRIYGGDFLGGLAGGIEGGELDANTIYLTMRISGGTIHRYLYGSGQFSPAYGTRQIVITGGTFDSWVSGGCYGTNNEEGNTEGNTYLYFGGYANQTNTEGIFGAGYGNYATGNDKYTVHNSTVVFADEANTAGSVYGGGNNGYAKDDINVYIAGGTISGNVFGGANKAPSKADIAVTVTNGTVNGGVYGGSNQSGDISGNITVDVYGTAPQPASGYAINQVFGGGNVANYSKTPTVTVHCGDDISIGELYGGGNQATVAGTSVTVSGGNRIGYVYGGGREAAVNGNSSVTIKGGTIENIFGGNNIDGAISGSITVTLNEDSQNCGLNAGNVFGAGNLATYNGNPQVSILNGHVSGNVYGGGKGQLVDGNQRGVKGKVTGSPSITIGDNVSGHTVSILGEVYGGGDAADVTGTPVIKVYDHSTQNNTHVCSTHIGSLYGGGNAADVGGTNITIYGGTITGEAYGGGHGDKNATNPSKYADVKGNVSFIINGGIISKVFAGSNSKGEITGQTVLLSIAKQGNCPMKIAEVYGGGNQAAGNAGTININCTGDLVSGDSGQEANPSNIGVSLEGIGTVYGGANAADINSAITLNINSGIVSNVFGGNNTSGNISGAITVNINKTSDACGWYVGNVFGGGNLAIYSGTPEVNIKNGTVSGSVYGGGNGDPNDQSQQKGQVAGSTVTIGDNTNNSGFAVVVGNVYGGGNAARVTGNTQVTYNDSNSSSYVAKLFGGGNAANVNGTTNVTLTNGKVTGGVYGGCNTTGSVGAVTVALSGGQVGATGDGNEANVYGGGFGSPTTTTGNISVTLTGTTVYGDIYGGSALGSVNASTSNTTTLNINGSNKLNGTIYGGGMGDNSTNPAKTAVSNGNVIINYAAANTGLKKGIYGGANINGNVKGKITLNINANVGASGDNSSRNIFGGGLGAATSTEGSITVNIGNASSTPTIYGDVYGGSALGSVNKVTTDVDSINFNKGTINGYIFGGGQGDNSTKAITNGKTIVNINTNASNNIKGIYGGANVNGNVKGDIVVNVYANVGATGGNSRDIFGGGLGQNTDTEGNVTVNIGTLAYDANKTPTIYGDIYGGSAKGNVNKLSTQSVTYYTRVNFQNGTLHGNIYGGGLGQKADDSNSAILAKVNGWVEVNIGSNSQSSNDCKIDLRDAKIFGGNNTNGSPQDSVAVRIYNTAHNYSDYSSGDRYKASYKPAANETAYYAIKEVFGGGNEADYTPVITNASYIRRTGVYVIGCDNTIERVFSGGNAAAATGVATHIDGGRFDYIYGGGNGEDKPANIGSGGTNLNVHGGIVNCLFGGSNHSGTISGPMRVNVDGAGSCSQNMYIAEFFCGNNEAPVNTNINAIIGCGTKFGDVYGGCNKASIDGDVILTIKGGEMNNVYGGSKGTQSDSANIKGNVTLNVYGGIIKKKAFGGSNINGNITGKITVNLDWSQADVCDPAISLRVDSIFGGSNLAEYTPDTKGSYPEVNIKHGTVGYVFGGGKGPTAIVHSNPVVTIGDSNTEHYAIVNYNVYGGGDAAAVDGYTVVTYDDEHANSHVGNLFGGGNAASVSGTATVTLTNGKVTSGIYGGCNASGSIGGKVTLNLNYGSVGTSSNLAGVYGGGLGADTRVNGDIQVNIAGSTIYGDVYGGSAKGVTNCNDDGDAHNGTSKTDVNLSAGTVYGSIYGGGHGIDNAPANVWGPVMVTVNGGSVQKLNGSTNPASIFGCNNLNGSPKDSVVVKILTTNATVTNNGVKTYAINGVYGGGNEAHYDPTTTNVNYPKVTVECGTSIKYVFGGGNAAAVPNTNVIIYGGDIDSLFAGGNGTSGPAHVGYKNKDNNPAANTSYGGGNTSATIYGGNIRHIFGGSNANGVIRTNGPLVINKTGSCDMIIGEVYGGGNQADGNASEISILNTGTLVTGADGHAAHPENIGVTLEGIGTVYGGANAADIGTSTNSSNITLNINSGMIANVFGGNNTTGTIYGTVLVNINQNQSSNWYVGNVFGGGNLADYSGATTVNITNGEVSQNVYGGGNEAGVGAATVNMNGGTVKKAVYGGCNTSGTVTGDIAVNFTSGTIGTNTSNAQHIYGIFGGGYGSSTVTEGDVIVTIGNGTSAPVVYGDVYGGSALGIVNDSTSQTPQTTKVWLKSGTVNGYVYGGGLGDNAHPALVFGDVQVVVDGGSVTEKIFGCNNVNGTPRGSVQVDINSTNSTQINNGVKTYALKGVYGGGNLANYVPTTANSEYPKVTVACGTSVKEVFGGGNAASVPNTNVIINGGDIDLVFAGGNGTDGAAHVGYNSKADNPAANTSYGDGNTSAVIHGGTINKIFGGSNANGIIRTTGTLEINKNADCAMYIGQVYGGGNEADGNASAISILNTGTLVTGDNGHAANPDAIGITLEGIQTVFGGANNANVGSSASNNAALSLTISSGMVANVFGGNNTDGEIFGTVEVNIDKNPNGTNWYVGNVFGAGKDADYTGSPNTYIKNGTVSGNVYGGGQGVGAVVKGNPTVQMTGGTVNGNIFGGGDAADVTGIVTVNIKGGTVVNDVYGGGALANTNIGNATDYGQANESVTSTTTNYTTVNLTGGTVKNVYGGGLGDADTEAKVYGNVFVNLNKGVSTDSKGAVITDYLFGCNNINGTPLGSVTVFVQGTQNSGLGSMLAKNNDSYDMKAIYGGGNLAAYIPKADTASTHVIINACRTASIEYVYGGGNAAPVPATDVKIYGSYKIGSLFGGGNGLDSIYVNGVKEENPGADVGIHKVSLGVFNDTDEDLQYKDPGHEKGNDKYILYGDTTGTSIIGTTHVTFYGGIVGHLFGGSNTKGDIIKKSNVILGDEDLLTCDFNVDDVYGGSNEAYMSGSAAIEMNCVDGMEQIYGGSRMADVNDDIVLTITGGKYGKVFGGNNISGRIFGSITVNIVQTGCLPIVIGELYGGGNQAPYSVYGYNGNSLLTPEDGGSQLYDDPIINIISCDSIGKVFGGGLGATAKMIGNPHVNINMIKGWTNGDYRGNGKQNDPHDKYKLNPRASETIGVIDTVFGGGNEAIVQGQTYINIGTDSIVTIKQVSNAIYKVIKNSVSVHGTPFASNDGDAVTKDLTISIEGANITGNIYGGGNNANVTGGTNIVVGREGQQQQQQQQQPTPNPAPRRPEQPQTQQPTAPQSNAATESQQTRSINATRL